MSNFEPIFVVEISSNVIVIFEKLWFVCLFVCSIHTDVLKLTPVLEYSTHKQKDS